MKFIYTAVFLYFITSCSQKQVQPPHDVLSRTQMTEVLRDIHIAQSFMINKSRSDSSAYSIHDYFPVIFKEHHTDRKTFDRSLKFYSANPELLKEVYDSVITSLTRMQELDEK